MENVRCKLSFLSMFVVDSVGRSGGLAFFGEWKLVSLFKTLVNATSIVLLKFWIVLRLENVPDSMDTLTLQNEMKHGRCSTILPV